MTNRNALKIDLSSEQIDDNIESYMQGFVINELDDIE